MRSVQGAVCGGAGGAGGAGGGVVMVLQVASAGQSPEGTATGPPTPGAWPSRAAGGQESKTCNSAMEAQPRSPPGPFRTHPPVPSLPSQDRRDPYDLVPPFHNPRRRPPMDTHIQITAPCPRPPPPPSPVQRPSEQTVSCPHRCPLSWRIQDRPPYL